MTETRLLAEYGLTDRFGAAVMIPFRVVRTGIDYIDEEGRVVDIVDDGIHHRRETLAGVADPWLTGRYGFRAGRVGVELQLGSTVPIGRTEEDPFLLGEMNLRHQHIQFGTGTFRPIAAAEAAYRAEAWALTSYALTVQSLYENDKGYRAGDRYAGGVSAQSPLGTASWRFRAGTEIQGETPEYWNGVRHTDEGNQGRVDWLASAGVSWLLGGGYEVTASVKVPILTHAVGGQLDYPVILNAGVAGRFALLGGGGGEEAHDHDHDHDHDDDHDHEHGDAGEGEHGDGEGEEGEVDWSGIDVAHVSRDGAAVPLEPVPGKVTVFDFWAPWCAPCKELDRRLAELARRHPDEIAIRKLNVVDWDSEATEKYLTPGGYDLPHVKVFDRSGEMQIERTAPPAELTSAIEEMLAE